MTMRFLCLDVTCGKYFGWTAKKIQRVNEEVTIEYVTCPYCGSLNFEELPPNYKPPTKMKKPSTDSLPIANMEKAELKQANGFDPSDLMKHSWKGKKLGDKKYASGNLEWGWDFKDKFKPTTVAALEKGSVHVDKYEFSLNDTGSIVHTHKVK